MATPQTASKTSSKSGPAGGAGVTPDAIALLSADHKQVAQWFQQFETARSDDKKFELASQICMALTVHTQIEEEIFYPAFLQATGDEDMNNEAVIEHQSAKTLIAEIEEMEPGDEMYDARVKVLGEMIAHHVEEEEGPDGMFEEARKADMDLEALGEQLMARKQELMEELSAAS